MKNKRFKAKGLILYLIVILAVIFASLFSRKYFNSSIPPVTIGNSEGDTIDVAIIFEPSGFFVYGDSMGGINYSLLKEFEKETGTPLKFWPVLEANNELSQLENGTYDMLTSIPSDYTIKKRFLTSESIYLDKFVLVQLADSLGNTRINSSLDLRGDSVHVQMDSPAHKRLLNLEKEIGGEILIIPESDLSEEYLCILVAKGIIPAAVVKENVAKSMKLTYPSLSFDNPVSFTQFQVWLIPLTDTILQHRVNTWFDSFKTTDTYFNILQTYAK